MRLYNITVVGLPLACLCIDIEKVRGRQQERAKVWTPMTDEGGEKSGT